MFEEKLREKNCQILLKTEEELDELLETIQKESIWKKCKIKVAHAGAGFLPKTNWGSEVAQETIDDLQDNGGVYAILEDETQKKYYPVNIDTTPFTLNDRAGVQCDLIHKWLSNENYHEWVGFVNKGLSTYDAEVMVLIRGGYVLAVNSYKYTPGEQKDIFDLFRASLRTIAPEAEFVSGNYDHAFTGVKFSLCDAKNRFMASYRNAWTDAGLPISMLDQTYPEVSFLTGDTGMCSVSLQPQLNIEKKSYALGSKIHLKHNGKLIFEALNEASKEMFANMQSGLETIENMTKIEINHPVSCFVRACEKAGVVQRAKKASIKILEDFKNEYAGEPICTAFDIYYSINNIQDCDEYRAMKESTKFQVLETLTRLLALDWKALDKVGKEDF